ncbi:MAG: DUF4124 domain-containing protein [Gammaproteobacteria bacterium]
MSASYFSAIAIVFSISALMAVDSQAAKVYRWVDENGKVHFSDKPPASGRASSASSFKTREGGANTASAEQRKARMKAMADSLQAEREGKQAAREADQAEAEAQEKRCKQAKSRAALWKQGGRIYKMDENGERSYYSSEEIDAKRKEGQRQIDKYCK